MTSTELQKVTRSENGTGEPTGKGPHVVFTQRVDVVETENELFLYADLPGVEPGVEPGEVSLNRKGNELILHARCHPRRYGTRALHAEYGVGDFYRAFAISDEMDCDKIEASLANGVLTVRVPKSEAVRPKRIAVKGG
jgi:HSP20 family protein